MPWMTADLDDFEFIFVNKPTRLLAYADTWEDNKNGYYAMFTSGIIRKLTGHDGGFFAEPFEINFMTNRDALIKLNSLPLKYIPYRKYI